VRYDQVSDEIGYTDKTDVLPIILATDVCPACGKAHVFQPDQIVDVAGYSLISGTYQDKPVIWRFEEPMLLVTGKTHVVAAIGAVEIFHKRGLPI
jgi:hypothetical protein